MRKSTDMLALLFKQPLNRWRQISLWQQLQLSVLGLVVFSWLIWKLSAWFAGLQVSSVVLGLIISHGFLLLSALSAPFVFKYALPRSKALSVFHTLPLSRRQSVLLLAWLYHLFQLPLLLLLFITVSALTLLSPVSGFLTLALAIGYDSLLLLITGFIFSRKSADRLIHFEKIFPLTSKAIQKSTHKKSVFQKSGGLRLLIKKELLSLWRNPHYRRLKVFTWIFYMSGLSALYFSALTNYDMWMMLFSAVLFWLHYNVHFNGKYVSADPDWYFRTLPLPFYRVWLSKFSTEILYILFLLFSQLLFLIAAGMNVWIQLNWIGTLLLFAVAVLSIVINFQILFYDNPRLAGYAYHFTILFIVIMSINYRLVGPLTAVFLLTFYFFKTRQFYNS